MNTMAYVQCVTVLLSWHLSVGIVLGAAVGVHVEIALVSLHTILRRGT